MAFLVRFFFKLKGTLIKNWGQGIKGTQYVINLPQLDTLLVDLNQTAMEQFQQIENQLIEKALPETIVQRHRDTVSHYQQQFTDLSARLTDIVNYRLPSYGVFSTSLQTHFFFGVPRNVNFNGLFIDVDRLAMQGVAKDNDKQKRIAFVRAAGMRSSAMEHLVPEQMFSTDTVSAQGISAAKALAIASAEGQRIWTIDQNNLNQALAAINLSSEIESEIRNAVLAGKVATAHDQPINFSGGTNTGYLLIDPSSGAGAYKISGGANGGFLKIDNDMFGFLGFTLGLIGKAHPLAVMISVLIGLRLLYLDLIIYGSISHKCSGLGLLMIIPIVAALASFFIGPMIAVILLYTSLLATKGAQVVASSAACKH